MNKSDKDDSIKTIQSKLIKTVTRSYEMTIELIGRRYAWPCDWFTQNANRIHTFGVGASGLVCSDIYFKLSRIGKISVSHWLTYSTGWGLSSATERT